MLQLNDTNTVNEFLQNHYRSLPVIDTYKTLSTAFLLIVYMGGKIVSVTT